MSTTDTPRRTTEAQVGCGRFLASCLSFGWRHEDLDALETLWWKYHNHRGELIETREYAPGLGEVTR